jgi:stearoyl-CoA desaturase (Delta-9 desaturase)
MDLKNPLPRSVAIVKSWSTVDWPSVFSAVIYPLLGVFGVIGIVIAALVSDGVSLQWWHGVMAFGASALTLFFCNQGVGGLHRIWQHRAGELTLPGQVIVMINCVLAMQGRVKDWVNYHSVHHRFSDRPGDPHNPHEGKAWAWIGWLIWRDPNDLKRPVALWLKDNQVALFFDRHMIALTLGIHLLIPLAVYAIVALAGGSLALVFLLHAACVIGRGVQFHATTLGVNVLGHLKTPAWVDWSIAILTGGEGLHDHHHDEPVSALHLSRRGFINRLVDYNGTMLLVFEKLRLVRNLRIAPQFA